ncbi:GNAT family N-acetyltransferase [Roseibium aggregatum]|uniref:GNAT family N-acetyltransferase n=1 Tax=Roseibium aggregatum TaxID=187304 RepID=A0A926P4Z8_9HYPH|nr:GNAT family N-acetyltransferase [Roseibium aggregatum]MBD1549673.1 GNAT family N-acetyltransferase [Roseibium aggregatum]
MPTDPEKQAPFTIQPFDPKTHDRAAFSCGVPQIDNYLKLTAKKGSKADVVRIWVVTDAENHIVGFYGINMHAVAVEAMPDAYKKKAMKHGLLPAAFIAMIGVDQEHQGNGLGSVLVADALNRIARASEEIGTCVIMLDVFDDGDTDAVTRRKTYYESFGFIPLPDQPLRLFMPVATAREASR